MMRALTTDPVSYTHLRAHETPEHLVCRLLLEKMSVEPSEALMIGDWPDRDVVGAKQIGMKTIFARYGDTFGTKESGADWDVNDIYEIVEIIKGLNNV